MKTSEFQTIKTLIEESSWVMDTNINPDKGSENLTRDSIEGSLIDGSNLIDLYISVMNDQIMTSDEFWKMAENCLVDERDMPRGLDEEN